MHDEQGRLVRRGSLPVLALALGLTAAAAADDGRQPFENLELRGIGPAVMGGRVSDFAFHPDRRQEFFAAHAVGGLWKTTNNGTTWTPVFDNEGAYSIGVVSIDPGNPSTVWVGTGENNSQRSVAYGDGVYKSLDGGATWRNTGLRESEHISRIWIDPDDSDHVLVASQGPLWNPGGDRGLFRTRDGGGSWELILEVDEYTGVNEFVVHPGRPSHIVATTLQRGRHVWGIVGGGPGSGIVKSTDGGATWRPIERGLPAGDKGRIGLAMAPSQPQILYAMVFAESDGSGFYRSTDFGESWQKRSDRMSNDAQYYNEITVDPLDPDRVYSVDTFSWITEDGGETFERLGIEHRHVDDHAFWIDPAATEHVYVGGDGGIYESWDRGKTWRHVRNLPLMQFYRVQADDARPYYNVYGGTQDASTWGGPSRTRFMHGIANTDWRNIRGGDGFEPQIDPTDPNIVYAQSQHAGLVRYDRRTTERVNIVPQPAAGETEYTWNWATPLLISPHDARRLYLAGNRLFRSDDRGDSWRTVSPDLTRGLDRNALPVMGRIWSVDALQKNGGVSRYGAAVSMDESPLQEGLLYVGMDDGRINVSEDSGQTWRHVDRVPGVPDMTYVADIVASLHDADTAYATFDNHKRGDYSPYLYVTNDRGRNWRSIGEALPQRGTAYSIAEDHVQPGLLFVGTEFGVWFSQDRGERWLRLNGGFPTIAVRDLEIQRRENDLVVGTYGRGIYILDDYTPLRTQVDQVEAAEATLFPVRDALLYIEGDKWSAGQATGTYGASGAAFFAAPNPPFGAVFTYYLRDGLESLRDERLAEERRIRDDGGDNPYPPWDRLRAEDSEAAPRLLLLVEDGEGKVVRRLPVAHEQGLHRANWDLRYAAPHPVSLEEEGFRAPWSSAPVGPLALPGRYRASLLALERNEYRPLAEPAEFVVRALELSPETTRDREALLAFQQDAAEMFRRVAGIAQWTEDAKRRLDALDEALTRTAPADVRLAETLIALGQELRDIETAINGDSTIRSRREAVPWSLQRRARSLLGNWSSQASPTATDREAYRIASSQFDAVRARIAGFSDRLAAFEGDLEALGAPWTPGRLPE